MRKGSAVALVALALLGLSGAPKRRDLTAARGSALSIHAATIEPTLPLMIDLRVTGQRGGSRGGTARLELDLAADADLDGVELAMQLPDGVAGDESPLAHAFPASLQRGERRHYLIPLTAGRAGVFPLRVHARFRLSDGRTFETTQGSDLRLGVPLPEGRSNAGAYEFMGVPLDELPR